MINRLVPEDDPQLAAWDMLAEMTREAEKDRTTLLHLNGKALPSEACWSMATQPR